MSEIENIFKVDTHFLSKVGLALPTLGIQTCLDMSGNVDSPRATKMESALKGEEMLALYRWFRLLMRKGHFLKTRYHKSHPHFLFYLALDALVTASVVIGGFQIAHAMSSKDPQSILLEHAGTKMLTLNEIIDHVREDRKVVYWLGAKPGYKYSPNCILRDVITITYFSNAQALHHIDRPKLTVQTYDNIDSYISHLLGYSQLSKSRINMQTPEGNIVEFDATTLQSETVSFPDDPHVVVINYPTRQSPESMLKNADRLSLVG